MPGDLSREEATLERLAEAPGGRLLTAVYLVGAYWSWWAVLAVVAFLVWRFADVAAALPALLALALLAAAGYAAKGALERRYGP